MAGHFNKEQYAEIVFQFIFNKNKFHEHSEVLNVKLSPSDQWETLHA